MEFYKQKIDEVIENLKTSKDGLTDEEAKKRLQKDGYNKLKETKKRGIFLMFLDQFKNVMLIILIISAIVSAFVSLKSGESMIDTIIILVVVFLNAILGVIQESKAEKAIEALKNMSLPYIKVKRDGSVESVKTEELVVGDIVLVEAGDSIPADMRIIENHSLRVEESALTGESVAVDKKQEEIKTDKKQALADRTNMLYSGSNVVYGRGEAVVCATGMNTELGKIADAISNQETEITPLQKKLNQLSKFLSVVVIIIAIIMFIVGFASGNNIEDTFMLAISLAVAAIPEGLSAVITITLAIGVQKMAKEKAIVRKLSAVEALGATEVICSDKTGTLTQNKMSLRKIYFNFEEYNVEEVKQKSDLKNINIDDKKEKDLDILAKIVLFCNDTKFGEDGGNKVMLGDPTETALIDFVQRIGYDKETMEDTCKRVDELPFDSTRKMMTTVNLVDNKYLFSTKGAVESILQNCTKILENGKEVEITQEHKDKILNENLKLAKQALRVLACSYKVRDNLDKIDKNENDLVFVGLVGMIDPPRKEAKKAVEKCFTAGMIPVMITGDNIDTAMAIAKELGILKENTKAVTGLEVDEMTDEELYNNVKDIRVYARVSPENKIRIVRAWKKHNMTVAMTGDGVNDAPALKGADIGIGMGITGTEVSKSVSSMVLADDNFSTIVVAVKEGRRIYNNIQNVIAYLLASNLAEVLIIFIATLFNKTIFLPIQILWINLITDTIPAIALGFEKEEPGIMRQKPRASKTSLFTPLLISRIVIPGVLKAVVILVLYFVINASYSPEIGTTAAFTTLAIIEMLFAFICRSDKKSIFKIGIFSNMHMLLCVITTLMLQLLILNVPVLSSWLGLVPLPKDVVYIIAVISVASVAVFECLKLILARIFIYKKYVNKNKVKNEQ